MKDSSGKFPCQSLGNKSQGESAVGDSSVAPSTNLSEDRVKELISSSLMDFSSSFASSMEESFARVNSLIESKLSAQGNVSQDATNFSFSEFPPVSVRQSLGTERQDPSQSNPQQDLGSGGEPVEPVQDLGAISPDLRSWVEGLRSAGVRIPQQLLDLSR